MKTIFMILGVFGGSSLLSLNAISATCSISVNREACPGKETEAWFPYGGVNPTSHSLQAKDQAKCVTLAQKAGTIARAGVVKKTTVTGSYGGNSLSPIVTEKSCEAASVENSKPQKLSKFMENKRAEFAKKRN